MNLAHQLSCSKKPIGEEHHTKINQNYVDYAITRTGSKHVVHHKLRFGTIHIVTAGYEVTSHSYFVDVVGVLTFH